MPVNIVSSLGTAFAVLSWIVSTVQALHASKEQMGVLVTSTKQLLATLNTEFSESRLVPEKCAKPLEDLETWARSTNPLFAFALNLYVQAPPGYSSLRRK
jgi:hypothetical protein